MALELGQWVRAIYRLARGVIGRARRRRGRRFLDLAQVTAIALLMRRERLGVTQCRALLRTRPDLRRAVRFLHVPSPGWFREAMPSDGADRAAGARRERQG